MMRMMTKSEEMQFNMLHPDIRAQIVVSERDNGCWLWVGRMNRNGYGRIWDPDVKKELMIHRYVWEFLRSKIPTGLLLDHDAVHCGNRNCCKPHHMSPVTVAVNTHRGKAALFKKDK